MRLFVCAENIRKGSGVAVGFGGGGQEGKPDDPNEKRDADQPDFRTLHVYVSG